MGVSELRESGLSHLDLKLDNVVIKSDFKLALIDFAHASCSNEMINRRTGTDKYLAPEVRYSKRDK